MNLPVAIPTETLPTLIDKASAALASARTSAEVLEAQDLARVAYDAAKSAARMAKAKAAHDDVIAAVYRAQADAAVIEARAKVRLADEYDAAQERGEIATPGTNQHGEVLPTGKDLGLSYKDVHEARGFRNADATDPGVIERAAESLLENNDEPTRAALRRSVLAAVADARGERKAKNPLYRKDEQYNRVVKFAGLCRSLAEFEDVEAIARWDRIPQTAERLPVEVREAMHILSRFMEARDA